MDLIAIVLNMLELIIGIMPTLIIDSMPVGFVVWSMSQSSRALTKDDKIKEKRLRQDRLPNLIQCDLGNFQWLVFVNIQSFCLFIPMISFARPVITNGLLSKEKEMQQPEQSRLNQKRPDALWYSIGMGLIAVI